MKWVPDDGGRHKAGYRGTTGDCVVRAVAIATGLPYQEVYEAIRHGLAQQRRRKGQRAARVADGVNTRQKWFREYMGGLGFRWVATMGVGTGCRVHLRADELPAGRLVAMVSKHAVAVIDGVARDTHDPRRGGKRCVYGYWTLEN